MRARGRLDSHRFLAFFVALGFFRFVGVIFRPKLYHLFSPKLYHRFAAKVYHLS
jgi:hypothetical protein